VPAIDDPGPKKDYTFLLHETCAYYENEWWGV